MTKKDRSHWWIVLLFVISLRSSCFALNIEDTFIVLANKHVPLFISEGTNFEYEAGSHGTNCCSLDTVLPPGTLIKVLDEEKNNTVHAFCKVSESCSFDGFIHVKFFEHSMQTIDGSLFDSKVPYRMVPNFQEVCRMLDFYRNANIPFSWGCNNLDEVDLEDLYTFVCKNSNGQENIAYRCVGFDCSGILHSISSWVLPHSTEQLYNFSKGKCLYELNEKTSDDELLKALESMKDTDFVVCPRVHVIISLHGGFIEAKGRNYGIVYTDADHALERLKNLAKGGIIRVIRWHPELLSQGLEP
ncbi:MAG: hypothetical protein LBB16_02875 [Puniceicoccales bacterium]|jgi:hypothetical protein|nr:hypothetical protein [Puniceicoccales bacterium]